MPDNILLGAALDYARHGWPVLPLHTPRDGGCSCGQHDCKSVGKHPRTLHGLKDATVSETTICRWWEQWADANVGAVTGQQSGLVVLDLDVGHSDGVDGIETVKARFGFEPVSHFQRTGGGGLQCFFERPKLAVVKSRCGTGAIAPGVELKADGGYVVLPPSVHKSGRHYEWLGDPELDGALPQLPGWALNGQGIVAIPRTDGEKIGEGKRNAHLASLAGALRRRGSTQQVIEVTLLAENEARCSPPLGEDEVRAIARSVVRYVPTQATQAARPWTDEEWPELTPLREDAAEPNAFPVTALPLWVREMVEGVAEEMQTPLALAGGAALGVLALAGGGKVEVEPRPGWSEPVNLFTCTALISGHGKTPTFGKITAPLIAWELRENERRGPEIARLKTEREILEKRLARLKADAAEGDGDAQREAVTLAQELAATPIPVALRLFSGDVTPEGIARLLSEQDGRIGVFTAEGAQVTAIIAGRYSRNGETNMDIYLQGYSGDPIRVDRANRERGPLIINRPALTVALCVQPCVLEDAWAHNEFGERGLLARFLWSAPASLLGHRASDPLPLADCVREPYEKNVLALLDLPATKDQCGKLPRLVLAEGAYGLLFDFKARLEPELAPEGRYALMTAWVNKLPGAIARIAGLLHLAAEPRDSAPWERSITAETMQAALELGRYYLAEAERVHKTFGGRPEARTAARVLDWIERTRAEHFRAQDLYRALGLRKTEAGEALDILEETAHVRPVAIGTADSDGRPGRKPGPTWEVNPALFR